MRRRNPNFGEFALKLRAKEELGFMKKREKRICLKT